VALTATYKAKKYQGNSKDRKKGDKPKATPPLPPPLPSPLAASRPQPPPNIVPVSAISPPPGNAAATREQFVAQHKIEQKSYRDYLSVEEVEKELILYAVGDNAVAPLKKQYIGFGDTTVLQMIDHLRLKTAIRMTTAQKFKYKTNGYNTMWDPTMSITAYFTQLDRFQVSLGDCGIVTSEQEKTMVAGAQMWQSEMFTEDQMVAWENRTSAT